MSAVLSARLDGRPIDALPLDARGLHYGDGVFRTLLLADGLVDDREGQLAQLAADAARLQLDVPTTLAADLDALASEARDGILKLILWRASTGRGYAPGTRTAQGLVLRHAPPLPNADAWTQGIAAMRSPIVLAAQPALAGIKHLNRLEQVLASRDWPGGVAEAILADDAGRPVCGSRTNLFWLREGRLETPALERCGIAGRLRARLLVLAAQLGLEVAIGPHGWDALAAADEAFVCNSVIGVWPLRAVDDRAYAAPGVTTRLLAAALAHPALRPAL